MAVTESNIKLDPRNVYFGNREITDVTCVADVSDSLNNTYFTMSDKDGNSFYVWYNTGAGVDPAPGGTGIQVSISTNDTATAVATATASAVDAVSEFNAVSDAAVVTIETVDLASASVDTADNNTGFTFTQVRDGSYLDIGATEGVELSIDPQTVDVVADQTGTQILDQIITGNNATLTVTMKEVTKLKLDQILGEVVGDNVTPAGGTKVTGLGTSRNFTNLSSLGKEVHLEAINGDTDKDIRFWLASPVITSLPFSGSEVQTLELEFRILRDSRRNTAVSLLAIGDGTQNVLA